MSAPEHPRNTDWAEAQEQQLLDAMLKLAPGLGWSAPAVAAAGRDCGFSIGETELLVPHGPDDLAALLSRRHDAQALEALAPLEPQTLKIRERIARAVTARLDAAAADGPAVRACVGYLALPTHLALGGRLAWDSADVLWRWAGDTATDENHYSKRAILAGVLTGAVALQMSSGRDPALAFVDRRIGDVMAFEKWKATTRFKPSEALSGFAATLGRLRYGAKAG